MKVQLTVEVDETEDVCDHWLDELELVAEHDLEIVLIAGNLIIDGIKLVSVEDLPSVGRPKKVVSDG